MGSVKPLKHRVWVLQSGFRKYFPFGLKIWPLGPVCMKMCQFTNCTHRIWGLLNWQKDAFDFPLVSFWETCSFFRLNMKPRKISQPRGASWDYKRAYSHCFWEEEKKTWWRAEDRSSHLLVRAGFPLWNLEVLLVICPLRFFLHRLFQHHRHRMS